MMKLKKKEVQTFQSYIFLWWKKHRRSLPWRYTHDPYKIMVSEVMLQQTQVSRVLPKYKEFLDAFPTVSDLAKAPASQVLRIWKGMGYNRRALYLKKAAMVGKFPKDETKLMKLPGIGKYTARAILVFAYKKDVALVDTNIRQIITHVFFKNKKQKESVIESVANQLVPKGKSWEWHQALMDYGALALPAVPGVVTKQSTFKGSNRYYRGKALDILRKGPSSLRGFSDQIKQSLLRDGLVVKKRGMYTLPT